MAFSYLVSLPNLILDKIPHLKVLKILKSSISDTQILREIQFGNLRIYKTAILAILEVPSFDFWNNSTFETEKNPQIFTF